MKQHRREEGAQCTREGQGSAALAQIEVISSAIQALTNPVGSQQTKRKEEGITQEVTARDNERGEVVKAGTP